MIVVGIGNDYINVGDGDDMIMGGLGDDIIFGNGGYDIVVFFGLILNYSWVEVKGNCLLVLGQDGNDMFKYIDVLQFGDFSIYINVNNGFVLVLCIDLMVIDENGIFDIFIDFYDFDGDVIMLSGYLVIGDGVVMV